MARRGRLWDAFRVVAGVANVGGAGTGSFRLILPPEFPPASKRSAPWLSHAEFTPAFSNCKFARGELAEIPGVGGGLIYLA